MMESIKELRRLCQSERVVHDTWHGRHIARPLSIYITRVFLQIGLSANSATFILLLIGMTGSLLLAFRNNLSFFAGMIILQLWYIIDHVDGEIARYRNTTSLTGYYFDCITHYITHPAIFLCTGFGLYSTYKDIRLFLAAIIAGYSVSMLTIIEDSLNSALYKKITNKKGASLIGTAEPAPAHEAGAAAGMLKRLFSFAHLVCTFPTIMNVLFFASLFNFFVKVDLIAGSVIFYSISATVVWVARVFVFIKEKKPDAVMKGMAI